MTQDLGGARYPVEVVDRYSAPLDSLARKLDLVDKAFDKLSKNRSLKVDLRDEERSAKNAERSRRRALTIEEKVERKVRATSDAREVDRRISARGLDITTKSLSAESRLAEASRKRAAALRQVRVEKQKLRGLDEGQLRELANTRASNQLRERTIKAIQQERLQRLGLAAQQRLGVDLGFRTVKALSAEEEAQKRVARAIRERAIAQNEITGRQSAGLPVSQGLLSRAGFRQLEGIEARIRRTRQELAGVGFSLQRILAAFVVFQAGRTALRIIRGIVQEGIKFRSEIQLAEISIAGLITSAGRTRDAFGNLVSPSAAFVGNLAQARELSKLILRDSLRTTSTYQELLQATQSAIAPGLRAGLDVAQIERLAILFSQAATVFNLPQNQLPEELRSTLQGIINLRNTRIPTLLGITNADIRRAKEAGDLYGFLVGRLEGLGIAVEEAAQGFKGLQQRALDAFRAVTGASSGSLFSELEGGLKDVLNLLVTDEGVAQNSAVAAFSPLFQELSVIVADLRDRLKEIDLDALVTKSSSVAKSLATALQTILQIVLGVADAFGIFSSVVNTDLLQSSGGVLRIFTRIAALSGIILAVFRLIKVPLNVMRLAFLVVRKSLLSIVGLFSGGAAGASAGGLLGLGLRFAGVIGLVATAVQLVGKYVFGIDDALGKIVKGTLAGLVAGFRSVVNFFAPGTFTEPIETAADRAKELAARIGATGAAAAASVTPFRQIELFTSRISDNLLASQARIEELLKNADKFAAQAELGPGDAGDSGRLDREVNRFLAITKSAQETEAAFRDLQIQRERLFQDTSRTSKILPELQAAGDQFSTRELRGIERLIETLKLAGEEAAGTATQIDEFFNKFLDDGNANAFVPEQFDSPLSFDTEELDALANKLQPYIDSYTELVNLQTTSNGLQADQAELLRQAQIEVSAINKEFAQRLAAEAATNQLAAGRSLEDLREEVRLQESLANASQDQGKALRVEAEIRGLDIQVQRRKDLLRIEQESVRFSLGQQGLETSQVAALETRLSQIQEELALVDQLSEAQKRVLQIELSRLDAPKSQVASLKEEIQAVREQERLATLQAQLANIASPGDSTDERSLLQARERLQIEQQRQALLIRRLELETAQSVEDANTFTAAGDIDSANASITKANALAEQVTLQKELATLGELLLQQDVKRAEIIATGSFTEGAILGLQRFVDQFESVARAGQSFIQGSLSATASGTTDAIIAAFNRDSDGVAAALNGILSGVTRSFVESLVNFLQAQLIDFAFGSSFDSLLGGGAEAASAAALTGAAAGQVTAAAGLTGAAVALSAAAAALASSAGVRLATGLIPGSYEGGAVSRLMGVGRRMTNTRGPRPRHLHPRDTVQAYLDPREYVITGDRVKEFGTRFFDSINYGGVVPNGYGDAAKGSSISPSNTPGSSQGPRGYAGGGSVRPGGGGGGDSFMPAILSRRELDRYNSGRNSPFIKQVRNNPRSYRTALAI